MVVVKQHLRKTKGKTVQVQSYSRRKPASLTESLRSLEKQMDAWLTDIRRKNSENIGFNIIDILSASKDRTATLSKIKTELAHLKFSDKRIEDAINLLVERGKVLRYKNKVELI